MEITVYYLERLNDKTLVVETPDQDLALKILSSYTGKDSLWLLFRIGCGKIIQNSTVSDTYFKKFLDITKTPIKDLEILSNCENVCPLCGK